MTKEKALEMSLILKAYSEGKTIQRKLALGWVDLRTLKSADLKEASMEIKGEYQEYRIKPEKKLVPFTFDDYLVGKVVVNKSSGNRALVVGQTPVGVYSGTDSNIISYASLLYNYFFDDNTTCGKYMEE